MGKRKGFLEIDRQQAPTRAVDDRVRDWREVYLPYPTRDIRAQGARCMDCGIPFCHEGCPLGNINSRLERPGLSGKVARRDRASPQDQQLP